MIFSENSRADKILFEKLLANMDKALNEEASKSEDYFINRGGNALEEDVYSAICECSKGTPFYNTINLVSGQSFPDIVINKYYGVEVKSTIKNHWCSTGSSILESTRIPDVERIYLTFGKLGKPVQFLTKSYEKCMSGVAVTHYPRYLIDMKLDEGETIFDKIGMPYDQLRRLDNPVEPIAKYYKAQLRPGESLWWASNKEEIVTSPPMIRLWNNLGVAEREKLVAMGYALFPNILGNASDKYNRFAVWLTMTQGIVNPCVRDSFSAGGQIQINDCFGGKTTMPASFGRIKQYKHIIKATLMSESEMILKTNWQCEIKNDRLVQWCELVSWYYSKTRDGNYERAARILAAIFDLKPEQLRLFL